MGQLAERREPFGDPVMLALWEGESNMRIKQALLGGGITLSALTLMTAAYLGTSAPVVAQDSKQPAAATSAAGKTYAVDTLHSSIVFKIKHMNAAYFYGTLNDFSGSFTFGETFGTTVSVKADSVDSRNDKRDEHIRNPDFFSAKEFPEMKFVASGIKSSGTDAWKGSGELTFRGVTKPVEIEVKKTGVGPARGGGEVAGFETSFTFKRSDFGSKGLIGPLSDDVTIIVSLEGINK